MKRTLAIGFISLALMALFACQKQSIIGESIEGPPIESNITLSDRVTSVKQGISPYLMKYSDTMLRCLGGGIILEGNSQAERALYYAWDATWKDLPMINRGIGGTSWRQMYPYIGKLNTEYKPAIVIQYQGDNEGAWGWSAETVKQDLDKYYEEWRRQNPNTWWIQIALIKTPSLIAKGRSAFVDSLNNFYRLKFESDPRARYVVIPPPTKWRTDGIHWDEYTTFSTHVKPVILELFNTKDTTTISPKLTSDTIFAFGSSTIAQWKIEGIWPGKIIRKAGYGGRTAVQLYQLTDTIRKVNPKQVLLYAGTNDVVARRTTSQVTQALKDLMLKIWAENPNVHISYITMHPSDTAFKLKSTSGETGIQTIEYTNRNIKNWINTYHSHHADVIETYSGLLEWNPKRVKASHFQADKLHLNQLTGYPYFNNRVFPALK
jgi:hypothetical protein